jgi:hypothetical protein
MEAPIVEANMANFDLILIEVQVENIKSLKRR